MRSSPVFGKKISREYSLHDLLKRPEVSIEDLCEATGISISDSWVSEQVEIDCKYEGYIARQNEEIERLRSEQEMPLPTGFDYSRVGGLSNEVIQKLSDVKPATLGQASRISGVTPAAVSLLLIYMKKNRHQLSKESTEPSAA